ncbi:MAG: septal ring lytic transglycosylase RlpA family protein [Desulfuromonadales bacterium]|nr:septal ring lytic transglycosylase RlpA family protein [Desulfuromonadales bacterium]
MRLIPFITSLYMLVLAAGLLLVLAACGGPAYQVRVVERPGVTPAKEPTQRAYEVNGQRYQPIASADGFNEQGLASWYGRDFHGRKTSNGEIYDMYAMTAAHKTLPMNVHVRVTNLNNGRSAEVRINDRGPFVKGRIIDLSYSAAKELDVVGPGTAPVRVVALGYRDGSGKNVTYRKPVSYRPGPFLVQVGAFTVRDNAVRLAAELQGRFGQSRVVEGWVNGRRFYRVRVGMFTAIEGAEQALLQLERDGYGSGFVVAE